MFQREQSIVITQRNDRTNLAAISHKIKTSCGIEDLGYDFSRINIARILWNFNPHWLRSQDGIPLGRPKPHCLSPYATQQLVQSLMHLLCLNKLAELLPTLRVDACIPLLERVLKNCGCVRGRKAFPCLQDQSTISFLLEMARKKEEFRIFLAPYLEDIFGVIVEFIDQAKSMDYGFLHSFFLHMLGLNCSSKDIVDLLTDFSNDRSRAMYQALYCEISKYLTEELTSTSVFFVDIFPSVTNHIRSISR